VSAGHTEEKPVDRRGRLLAIARREPFDPGVVGFDPRFCPAAAQYALQFTLLAIVLAEISDLIVDTLDPVYGPAQLVQRLVYTEKGGPERS
jgi:hypothetical protein